MTRAPQTKTVISKIMDWNLLSTVPEGGGLAAIHAKRETEKHSFSANRAAKPQEKS